MHDVKTYIFLALTLFLFAGCATGHCPPKGSVESNEVNRRVWVYKYDNSKQCEAETAISPEEMIQQDFQNIKVWEFQKKNDGQQRVQFCGAYTGSANLFLIDKKSLPVLKAKGYEIWDF